MARTTHEFDSNPQHSRKLRHAYSSRARRLKLHQEAQNPWPRVLLAIAVPLVLIFASIFGCSAASLLAGYAYLQSLLPEDMTPGEITLSQSSKIYDRNGNLLFEVFDNSSGRRTNVPPDEIPAVLKQATIATEDPTFYENPGVDVEGVLRAFYYLWREQRVTVGGSTITQQLVKNTLLTPEVTVTRKVREILYAYELTQRYSKDEILAMYLNTIPFGNLSYGVQAAAQSYFGKDVSEVDLPQASLLAGLPQAPSVYDPCHNPDAALGRQRIVLDAMVREGYITSEEADDAALDTENLIAAETFQKNCSEGIAQVHPHFVEYVREQLELIYGPEVLYKGGLQVHTSIDPEIQKIAEEEARKQIALLQDKNVTSASVVVMNPQTGEIYAMVGSVDFNNREIDGQVNVANRLRQPGSSIKPINYVTALEMGWNLATPLYDARVEFPDDEKPYVPVNYDGKFHGFVSLRSALANSYNIPAIKTLYYVTVPRMIASAQRFGITTFGDPERYGLSLTLGGGEVKLVELTGAYAVFANGGRRAPVTPFTKIVDGEGNVLFDAASAKENAMQAIDPRHAYLITSVLSDNKARTPAFGQNSPLKLCLDGTSTCKEDAVRPVAAKTGTTNDYRDNWTLGYTPQLVVGVWVGNPRNEPMKDVSGITGAAPIWHNIMARLYAEIEPYKSTPPTLFPVPNGLSPRPCAVHRDCWNRKGAGAGFRKYFTTSKFRSSMRIPGRRCRLTRRTDCLQTRRVRRRLSRPGIFPGCRAIFALRQARWIIGSNTGAAPDRHRNGVRARRT
jgi:1A family penicillin-binding protein